MITFALQKKASMKKQLERSITTARRYPFSTLCVVLIWLLSLTPYSPETPFDNVAFIDKWTHFVMYGGSAFVVWCEYWHHHHRADYGRLWLWAGTGLSLMGGMLELIQEYCTTERSGDWIDFLADGIGAIGVCLIGSVVVFFVQKNARH